MAFPPPPPSARNANPDQPASEEPNAPLPSFEHGTPIGMGFDNVAATDAAADAEVLDDNPFHKPNRFREWLKKPASLLKSPRAMLKKPSREFTIRAAIGVLALTVGWGVGAKPWKPAPTGRTIAAAKAGSAKAGTKANAKGSTKGAAAKAGAVKAAPVKEAPAAAEPVRRVASVRHELAPVKVQSRVASKSKVAPAKKTVSAKTVTKAKAAKAKPKAVAKAAVNSKAKAKAKPKVSAKAKLKTTQG